MQDAEISTVLAAGPVEESAGLRWSRRLLGAALVAVVVGSIAVWWATRETLPPVIRMATGEPGGLYYRLGGLLEPHIERNTGRKVEILSTEGTVENQAMLKAGDADVAILQGGAGELDGLVALAPLYYDVLHVIARRDLGLQSLQDLSGHRLAVGSPRSGMLESARDVLSHYDIARFEIEERYFGNLVTDPALDAAIVTTGLTNPDLDRLLESGEFDLLPIRDAEALSILHPHFEPFTIPRGLFAEGPAIPATDVPTVATTSYLAVRGDASNAVVGAVLRALYESDLRQDVPTLISRSRAAQWDELPIHPAARSFFQPYGGLDVLANFMESLAALKELLFAFGAGLYLAWIRWRRAKDREERKLYQRGKDRLDVFLEKSIEIERRMLGIQDQPRLREALREITELKHRALRELTHESLRGDVTFAIFLQQCGDVIRRTQNKLRLVREGVHFDPEPVEADASSRNLPSPKERPHDELEESSIP